MNYLPLLLLLFISSFSIASTKNISVFVDAGGEAGQGLLVSHAGTCQAIVPTHVVKKSSFISAFGRGNKPAIGDALGITSFGYDLSVMQIDGELATECGPLFDSISRNVDSLINEDQRAQSNTVNPDGTVSRIPLTILDQSLTYVVVTPTYASDKLMKGMSGSLITVKGKPLGLLLSVDHISGAGKVIRIDRVLETISPYFHKSPTATKVAKKTFESTDKRIDGNIVEWSVPAVDGQHRAQNLLADNDELPPWLGNINKFPVSLVLSISNSSQELDKIILSGKGLEENTALARQVEVLIDQSGTGRWRSLKAVTMPKEGGNTAVNLDRRKAHQIMLRIHNNWGNSQNIGLGRVYIVGTY